MSTVNLQVILKGIEVDAKHPGLTHGRLAALLEQFLRESLVDYPRTDVQRELRNLTFPGINAPVIDVKVIKRRKGERSNYADGTRS